MEQTIGALDPKDAGVASILNGVIQMVQGVQTEFTRCAAEKNQYQIQLASIQAPNDNIIAEGKQKELIAILDVIYDAGYTCNCTKGDFMKRAAIAFGSPGLADYASALYNIKSAYKYEGIFDELSQVAHSKKNKED